MGDEQHSGCMKTGQPAQRKTTGSLERDTVTGWELKHQARPTKKYIHAIGYIKLLRVLQRISVVGMSQSVSVHFQYDGVTIVKYKDAEYHLETACTTNLCF